MGHHLSCPPTHTGNSCFLPLSPKLNYICLFFLLLLLYTNKIQCQSNPGKTDHSVASQNIFVMILSGVLTALSCDFIKCGDRAPPFSFFSRRKFSPFLHKPDYMPLVYSEKGCCYVTVDSPTTAIQSGACTRRCISKQMHYKTTFFIQRLH